MDFRNTEKELDLGKISRPEVEEQILNLPCLYTIVTSETSLFYSEKRFVFFFSKLEFALAFANSFNLQKKFKSIGFSQYCDADIIDKILDVSRQGYRPVIDYESDNTRGFYPMHFPYFQEKVFYKKINLLLANFYSFLQLLHVFKKTICFFTANTQ